MKTELNLNEKIIKSGFAGLQKGIETVGGKLYLTNKRLIYETHSFNIQRGVTEIELSRIFKIRKCWLLSFGVIPQAPTSLAVITIDGKEYRFNFTIFTRGSWKSKIEEQMEKII